MNRIKICGLKRMEDILAVNEYKPEYIGFVLQIQKDLSLMSLRRN